MSPHDSLLRYYAIIASIRQHQIKTIHKDNKSRHTERSEVSILATYGFKGDSLTLGESKCDSFDSLLQHCIFICLDSRTLDTSLRSV